MDKNENISSTGGQVDKGESSCVLRLCLMSKKNGLSHQSQHKRWKGQLMELQTTVPHQEPIESSGIISQDSLPWKFPAKIQDGLRSRNIEPEIFGDQMIFMSMFNDIDWKQEMQQRRVYFKFRTNQ